MIRNKKQEFSGGSRGGCCRHDSDIATIQGRNRNRGYRLDLWHSENGVQFRRIGFLSLFSCGDDRAIIHLACVPMNNFPVYPRIYKVKSKMMLPAKRTNKNISSNPRSFLWIFF